MRLGAVNKRNVRRIVLAMIACGGLSIGSVGCDKDVNYILATGLNSAANVAAQALIDAAFQTVTPDVTTDTVTADPTAPTV